MLLSTLNRKRTVSAPNRRRSRAIPRAGASSINPDLNRWSRGPCYLQQVGPLRWWFGTRHRLGHSDRRQW